MPWLAPALGILAVASVPLIDIDLRQHRLPNRITIPLLPALMVALAVAAAGTGKWDGFTRALLAGAALAVAFLALHLVHPGGLGFGDVKLAPSLGLVLGWWSWDAVIIGTFAAFVLSAVVAISLLVLGRATLRTALPFGPFMLAGAWLVIAGALAAPAAG